MPKQTALKTIALVALLLFHHGLSAEPSKDVSMLIQRLKNQEIDRIVVLQATDIVTQARMVPKTLTVAYTQRMEYELRRPSQRRALILLLQKMDVRPSANGADIRAGIIFVESRTGRQYGIFCDGFGHYGYMGEIGQNWDVDDDQRNGISMNTEMWNFISRMFHFVEH